MLVLWTISCISINKNLLNRAGGCLQPVFMDKKKVAFWGQSCYYKFNDNLMKSLHEQTGKVIQGGMKYEFAGFEKETSGGETS